MAVLRVGHRRLELDPVRCVSLPCPHDDRLLLVQGEQVPPALAVAVPQLDPARDAAQRPPDDPAHHRAPRQVEPDHGVRARPDEVPDLAVIPVDHPALARHHPGDPGPVLLIGQRHPAGLVIDRVEFEEISAKRTRQRPGQGDLPAPEVPTTETRRTGAKHTAAEPSNRPPCLSPAFPPSHDGHMTESRENSRKAIRAPRGAQRSCKGWAQEAAMRMLMNNLDPEVAEHPDQLIVYGGSGRAARSWDAYAAII